MALVTESAATSRSLRRLLVLPDWPNASRISPPTPVSESPGGMLPGVLGALREDVGKANDNVGDLLLPDRGELFGVDLGDA